VPLPRRGRRRESDATSTDPAPTTSTESEADESTIAHVAHSIASAGAVAGAAAGAAAGRLIASAREVGEGGREIARVRRSARKPLQNLYDRHPEARFAARSPLGLLTIPVSEVRGTAVEGPAQRGGDFLPLRPLRSGNWTGRWQRIRNAQERLVILPPIDVLQTRDGYWVTDGHNRVAAALYGGQDEIDAVVTHVHLPGDTAEPRPGSLAAGLAEAGDLRAAGEGRLSRGSSLRTTGRRRSPERPPDVTPEGPPEPGDGRS
jgi:hypothetical protein